MTSKGGSSRNAPTHKATPCSHSSHQETIPASELPALRTHPSHLTCTMLLQTIISTLFLAATATAFQWPLRGNQLLGWFEDFKEGEVPQKYRSGNSAFNGTCDTLNLFRAGVEGFLTLSAYCLDSHANNSTRYLTELNLNRCLLNYDGQLSYSISRYAWLNPLNCARVSLGKSWC
ncbi:hypothetical protein B0T10DRAFT_477749 [Thelonectria olida]|uniref:Cyanovirin-N domain-containing protein n=1 Tax=Thelonectria olida TaxID=1576542 RepID=A0A9P9AQP9_9HYPO|nr:hypothetical protein B0T10DRAFT_477749 [Thelonectria olida]